MQVSNNVTAGKNYQKNGLNENFKKVQYQTAFAEEPPKEAKTSEEKKQGLSVKKITNVAGAVLGVGAVSAYLISQAKRPKLTKLADGIQNGSKGITKKFDNIASNFNEIQKGKKSEGNLGYRAGLIFNKWSEQGKEITNNLVYGFGTVVVMPLIILFSPFGKKKSSTEDKAFTALRQPISFATLFSMQLTVDKFLKGMVPKIISSNKLEDKDLKDAKGNVNFDKIKYNKNLYKGHLMESLTKVGNLSKDKAEELFKLGGEDAAIKKLNELVSPTTAKKILPKMQQYFKVGRREELLQTAITILINVGFSAPVGCTLLNIIYGKTMKSLKPILFPNKSAPTEESKKGGQA